MKYKVGDKVRVRKDLKAGYYYIDEDGDELYSNTAMSDSCGETLTVSKASLGRYLVKENEWLWCAEMFDGLADKPAPEPQPEWTWEDLF